MNSAGVSRESLRMRLSAGCRRICSASKDSVSPTGIGQLAVDHEAVAAAARRNASTISGK